MSRFLTSLLALLFLVACSSTPGWKSIPQPWTAEVIDVQRRVRVVPTSGSSFEIERPQYQPEGRPVLAWRGEGPDQMFPNRSLPLVQVADILAVAANDADVSGNRVAQASLVTIGVILWVAILVAIFV